MASPPPSAAVAETAEFEALNAACARLILELGERTTHLLDVTTAAPAAPDRRRGGGGDDAARPWARDPLSAQADAVRQRLRALGDALAALELEAALLAPVRPAPAPAASARAPAAPPADRVAATRRAYADAQIRFRAAQAGLAAAAAREHAHARAQLLGPDADAPATRQRPRRRRRRRRGPGDSAGGSDDDDDDDEADDDAPPATQRDVVGASRQLTSTLQQAAAMMTAEVHKSAASAASLDRSTRMLASTASEYRQLGGVVGQSRRWVTQLRQRDSTERWLVTFGLSVFCLTVLHIVRRRLGHVIPGWRTMMGTCPGDERWCIF
ncbi:hypothetical protein CXG81DRAFT_20444 [Caulochytrium protostelioides]|uniref:Sec20 C-terminal domain-containing protein n=1 Tax=Caulochytrium protostelioides TaxID=1555241 RepID=A0A4P9X382_9FUNG|nr:hypothetical protein CXG81DRAFT_20444 [Caulochytrium protostelioides]|eukprot:RKO99477.1 hypothetical protein CXG81DRAFT_20444 [Caulochytrium protostelioides]